MKPKNLDVVAIGNDITNTTANSVILGNSSTTSWLPPTTDTVNLGSATNYFKDVYVDEDMDDDNDGALDADDADDNNPNVCHDNDNDGALNSVDSCPEGY